MPQLEIYLNDHLAGATGGVELARRLRASNRDDAVFGETLSRVCAEIEADRTVLEQVIEGLGYSRSKVKPAAAWVAEKLGRLKLNGQLRGYSPLSRLIELEGLLIGITGKIGLWQTLAELGTGEELDADLEQLTARAAAQRAAIDDLHRIAAAAVER
jgi:cell division protein FtsB